MNGGGWDELEDVKRLSKQRAEALRDCHKIKDALHGALERAFETMRHMDPLVEERWKADCEIIKAALKMVVK